MDTMENIFSDVKSSVDKAAKKSGELLEITKIKMAIASTKSEIRSKFAVLGKQIYEAWQTEGDTLFDAEGLMKEIQELYNKREKLEYRLMELKNRKMCGKCGAFCEADAAFCSKCGAKFVEASDGQKDETDAGAEDA